MGSGDLIQKSIDWRSDDVSRFTLLLLSSALMLVIAACDTNGDDDATDDLVDDTTELPADDGINGDDDVVTTEDDEAGFQDDAEATQPADDAEATEPGDDVEIADPEDDGMTQDDEMAFDDEEAVPDPEDMEPVDPNQGMFFDLSAEEANEMTTFEVREPEYIPEGLEFQTIMGMASMEASEEEMAEEAATITFAYQQPPEEEGMQGLPVEFMQSTELDMREGVGPDAESEELTIGDREVTRVSMMTEMGEEFIAWIWDEDEVHFSLAAMLGESLTEDDLEAMIESVPSA
jgi:hypothetical protein